MGLVTGRHLARRHPPSNSCVTIVRMRPCHASGVEDLVAVEVELDNGEKRYFVTWGRVQDEVDPSPLEALVIRFAARCVQRPVVGARVCLLREAHAGPYLLEALFEFSRKRPPRKGKYERWRREMARRMEAGNDIYFLGNP